LQAKALGDVLVVGLIPDSEILRCKGPPVLNERERYLLVDAVKWVDEVLQGEGGHVARMHVRLGLISFCLHG
jgi:ethanolamine-phosphate cytidylyltransferase